MKKEKENIYSIEWVLFIFIVAGLMCLCSCSQKSLTGTITQIKGNEVTIVRIDKFKVKNPSKLHVGKEITFTRSVNRSKINSKRLK